jgi:hypothetical protein
MQQPDPPLSAAAADVRHELEAYARRWPEASAVGIVWHLARVWIPARLKRRWRR